MPLGGFCPLPIRLGGDATSGWTAYEHARACADLVAVKRGLPFAVLQYTPTGPTASDVTLEAYFGRNGIGVAYGPTLLYNADGDVTLTFATSYEDAYGKVWPTAFRQATARCSDTIPYRRQITRPEPNVVRIKTYDMIATGLRNATTIVVVYS